MAYEDEKRRAAVAPGIAAGRSLRGLADSAVAAGKTYANMATSNAEGMVNAATAPARKLGGMALDVEAGFTGRNSPNAGNPIRGLSLPRPFDPSPTAAPARADFSGVTATVTKTGRAVPSVTAPVPAAAPAPAPTAPPTVNRNFNLKPGDRNTFTFSDGRTVAVPGLLDAGAQPAAGGFQRGLGGGQQVQYRDVQAPGGAMGANIAAMTDDQKAQMRQDDFRWAMRGANTRSARQAVADAYVAGEQVRGAERRADIEARSAENIAAGRNATDIARTNAEGRLAADRINADMANSAADRDNRLEEARITRRLQPTMLEDGTIGQIGDDGTFTPITDAAGKPVRGAQSARQSGDLTASDLLKSYDTRRAAIETSLADDAVKQQQLAALDADPMYAPLRGTTQAATQPATEDDFVRQAVAAGHDPEKARAFWRNKQKGSQQQ